MSTDDDNNETEQSLGVRAVACKGFLWMPGMLAMYTWGGTARDRFLCADDDGVHMVVESKVVGEGEPLTWLRKRPASFARDCLPDLDDPATLGCLLALVREAWGGRRVWVMQIGGHWRVGDSLGWVGPTCDTEAEALVAALEAAP